MSHYDELANINLSNYSFNIQDILNFIINNYKQLLLLLLVFVIIYVVDHITYYNGLFYGLTNTIPGVQQSQTKSNTFKNKQNKQKK